MMWAESGIHWRITSKESRNIWPPWQSAMAKVKQEVDQVGRSFPDLFWLLMFLRSYHMAHIGHGPRRRSGKDRTGAEERIRWPIGLGLARLKHCAERRCDPETHLHLRKWEVRRRRGSRRIRRRKWRPFSGPSRVMSVKRQGGGPSFPCVNKARRARWEICLQYHYSSFANACNAACKHNMPVRRPMTARPKASMHNNTMRHLFYSASYTPCIFYPPRPTPSSLKYSWFLQCLCNNIVITACHLHDADKNNVTGISPCY